MLDDSQPTRLPKPTSAQLRVVHQACERFEQAWRQRQQLTIEQLLDESTVDVRPYLLEALVRSEVELLEASGRPVEPREYLKRFASQSGIVARAFCSADKLESLDSGADDQSLESVPDETIHARDMSKPERLGHFEIRDEIARGGMGVVYRGWHEELKREVAVKCIHPKLLVDDANIQRFRRETQTVALLKHDGIIPIYEVGHDQGLYYFVMPLIDGENLSKRLSQQTIAHAELARIVRDAAVATQFAHEHGVVHRDLKPGNIMIDRQNKVWVTDFGLAKSFQSESMPQLSPSQRADYEQSMSGIVVGTPAYMAPEQVNGKADKLTDVYGLGAILYTGLTGRPPHRAATVAETFKQILEQEPVAPRTLDKHIPRDLESIAFKALSKSPPDRYDSAAALADDLTRYLEGRPVSAKPTSPPERIWRWMKREPLVASLATGIIAALAIGLGISMSYYFLAAENARSASKNAELAILSVEEYLTQVADSPELGEKGLELLRRRLLTSALDFYHRLAEQSPSSRAVQERIAAAHERLGMIHSTLGELDKAADQFQRTAMAYTRLNATRPQLHYRVAIVEAMAERSQVLARDAKVTEALALTSEAIALCDQLVSQFPDVLPHRILLAFLYALEVEDYTTAGKADAAKQRMADTLKLCEELVPAAGAEIMLSDAKRLALTLDRLASQLQAKGEFDSTEKLCKLGIDMCNARLLSTHNDPQIRFHQAKLHKNLNLLYMRTQRYDESAAQFASSNAILTELLSEHPLVSDYLDQKATLLANATAMLVLQGKLEEARKLAEEAIEAHQQLLARQPDSSDHWNGLSNVYATLGTIHRNSFQFPEAETAIKLGLQANAKVTSAPSESSGFFRMNLTNSLAETYLAQKQTAQAADILRPLSTDVQTLVEKNQAMFPYQLLSASVHRSLAISERKLNNLDAAQKAARHAVETYEALPAPVKKTGATPRVLIDSMFTDAYSYFHASKYAEAQAAINLGLQLADAILQDPKTPANTAVLLKTSRGELHDLSAQIDAAQGKPTQALEKFHLAIVDEQDVIDFYKDKPVPQAIGRELCASVHVHVSQLHMQLEQWQQARESCIKAIELQSSDQAQNLLVEIEKHLTKN